MGLFDNIFGGKERREREMDELMNPLLGYRFQHFVAFTADPSYLRHWFSFINKQGQIEEFITNYGVLDGRASYIRTHWKKPGDDFFVTLSERGPWSAPITFLVELGKRLPVNTMAPETHPARNVSPGPQRHPDWRPPPDATPKQAPPVSPHQWQPVPKSEPSKPPERDLDGLAIGEVLHFGPLRSMARIIGIEEYEGRDGTIDRFIVELDDDETEMKVPVSRLREMISRKPREYTDEELEDLEDDAAQPIRESNGFRVNEFVVYPAHGVGQILEIEEQEIAGAKLELFVINFMKDKMTLRVPAAKIGSVGMRKLSDPALVERALEALNGYPRSPTAPWPDQAKEGESKINSGDIIAVAEVVRDLYRPQLRTERLDGEQHLYEAALDRLAREIAAVRHSTEADVVQEIERRLAKSYAEKNSNGPISSGGPGAAMTIVNTPWEIKIGRYHEIGRTYEFNGLAPPNTYRKIEVRCRLLAADAHGAGRAVTPMIYFEISPRMMAQTGYLAAKFSPSDSESKYGGIAIKVEHTGSGSNLLSVVPTDADQCIRALMAGRQITVRLMAPEGEFAAFPLENDASFASSYARLLRLIEAE
jgi:CarD family transcriptional regulator